MLFEPLVVLLCLGAALALKPWQFLIGGRLLTPMLASLVILPWLWALPSLQRMPLQLQASGACLVLLMLGWPLAVPVLVAVGLLTWLIAPLSAAEALSLTVWLGLVPATLALLLGAGIRRFVGVHLFVYLLGRAFIGTALVMFASGWMAQAGGQSLPGVEPGLSLVARWLMAWGDAFVTGMLAAVFVAFKPQWLATYSDRLYLPNS